MPFDGFVMAAVAAEVEGRCRRAYLDQVYQPRLLVVVLAFTGGGPRRWLLLSAEAENARAHLLRERPPSAEAAPPGFCMLLRKELRGTRLAEVTQHRFDRILRLGFRRADAHRVLVHEVMGRHSNLLLLDEEGRILGALKVVPPSRSRARPVLPGQPYQEPPTSRLDPRAVSRERFLDLAGGETLDAAWLVRTFNGLGDFAATEILARAGAPADRSADRVYEALRGLLHGAAEGFEPVVWRGAEGEPTGTWAFRSRQQVAARQEPESTMSAALEAYYVFRAAVEARESARAALLASLRRAATAGKRQRDEARTHLEGREAAELLRISGELLTGAAGQIPRGAGSVELPNYYDPEQRALAIALDPRLSARENAGQYFRRYRRAAAAAERAAERLPALERRLAQIEALLERAAAAPPAELDSLVQELKREGLLRERPEAAGRRAPEKAEFPAGVRIRRREVDGWEVLWGENATSNDYLTTRVARPDDLWLHARAVTGAHVVVRTPTRGAEVPRRVLEAAARIAAAHCEAKHSSVVPVDYTFRRYVRKPRGAKPGVVLCQNEKTIDVRVEG